MVMNLFEGFNIIDGDLCTPQGFVIDTFECYINGLISCVSVLIADNPCTISFKYPKSLLITKGIAQAIIVDFSNDILFEYYEDLNNCISNQLGLYDDSFLVNLTSDTLKESVFSVNFAVQFCVSDTLCSLGMLKRDNMVYITTDVAITSNMLESTLNDLYHKFNLSDTFCILASGQAGNMTITTNDNDVFNIFKKALYLVVMNLY